jgi:hypothetical protein
MRPFEKQITCLVVEPGKKPSVQVIDNTLEAKQELVGGLIELVRLSDTADLICNDEGKLMGLPANRIVGNDVIAGTFFVVGCEWDNENFVSLSDEDIKKFTEEFDQTLSEQVEARQEYFIRALMEMM